MSGEPGLVDRVLALHAESRRHISEPFFRSNRPGYQHPVSSELENSGIRVAVGDYSVTERRRGRLPYQAGKNVDVLAKHFKHNEDRRTAPGVCGNGSVPPSHSGNVVTGIGIHTHTMWTRLTESPAKWVGCSPCTHEVEGSTPTGGTCPNDFSDPIDQDIRTHLALSWKKVVSVVAVGDLIKQAQPKYI